MLAGGTGDDLLNGGPGRDTLTGGEGADIFRIGTVSDRTDVINDFNVDQGDKLLLTDLLQGTGFNAAQAEKWLQFQTADLDGNGGKNDVQVRVDLDGSGGSYQPTVIMQMHNPIGLVDQMNSGTLDIDKIIISRKIDPSGAGA